MTTFQSGDIVLEIGDDKEWSVTEISEGMVIIEDDDTYHAVMPSRLALVYRPPTREEVEDLRSRVALLEAALRLFMDDDPWYNGGTSDEAYTAGMKAMGLEP